MDKLNYFKYFTNISHIFIKLYNNYELRHIIHSNIIFIINLLIKYEKKISVFFFDIDIQASNLLLIISFSISLLEILSTQKKNNLFKFNNDYDSITIYSLHYFFNDYHIYIIKKKSIVGMVFLFIFNNFLLHNDN